VVICLERGADLHIFQLMPLPLTVSCFSKTQIGFAFLVPAHLGSPGKRAVKWVCVRVTSKKMIVSCTLCAWPKHCKTLLEVEESARHSHINLKKITGVSAVYLS